MLPEAELQNYINGWLAKGVSKQDIVNLLLAQVAILQPAPEVSQTESIKVDAGNETGTSGSVTETTSDTTQAETNTAGEAITPAPPVDNAHVAEGATQFTEAEIAANAKVEPASDVGNAAAASNADQATPSPVTDGEKTTEAEANTAEDTNKTEAA